MNALVDLRVGQCGKEEMQTIWMVLAIVNTGISALLALDSISKGYGISSAVPNGVLAIVCWSLAVIA